MLKEWRIKFEVPAQKIKRANYAEKIELRHKLMAEENDEYLAAAENKNKVEIADALGDMLYILCGTIIEHGMEEVISEVFEEIHRSNMSKLGDDGKPVIRNDGKIIKGPDYFRPDLLKIVYKNEFLEPIKFYDGDEEEIDLMLNIKYTKEEAEEIYKKEIINEYEEYKLKEIYRGHVRPWDKEEDYDETYSFIMCDKTDKNAFEVWCAALEYVGDEDGI
jgi:phosphoribosyl-ATP pyrophosphohydrolase